MDNQMSSNKIYGDVPTAPAVVRYMLDLVGYTANSDLSQIYILEPSCGEGAFIIEIAKRLKESSKIYGYDAQTVFNNCVFGYDIIPEKIDVCAQRLKNLDLDIVDSHIKVGDFLTAKMPEMDIVVGNPPYVRYENISKLQLEYIKKTFPTFHYRADLYIPFFEKTLRLLKPNGAHCFICANRWLKNEYGKKLRKLISCSFRLEKIINLEHADAFKENVLAYPAITLISKNSTNKFFEYTEIEKVSDLAMMKLELRAMPYHEDWSDAFNTIEDRHLVTIEDLGFNIGIGVATGADSVFISDKLPELVEKELLIPSINAKDLRGNVVKWHGEYLLNPYSPNGELINLLYYPKAAQYLQKYKKRLAERHVVKKNASKWYKTIDRIYPNLKSETKILLPDMSSNSYIFVDEGNYYPLHNIYYITGKSVRYLRLLSAILMSDIVQQQIRGITNNMNGGFPRWQSQYLRKLRVPDLRSINEELCNQLEDGYIKRDYETINSIVSKMYETGNTDIVKHRVRELELEFDVA